MFKLNKGDKNMKLVVNNKIDREEEIFCLGNEMFEKAISSYEIDVREQDNLEGCSWYFNITEILEYLPTEKILELRKKFSKERLSSK